MADNYIQTSCLLKVPTEKLKLAEEIINRCLENNEDLNPSCDIDINLIGIWFNGEECVNPDAIAVIAQTLLDELELDEPFVFSWAYTCSRPKLDKFGGGACALKRGQPPFWVDAYSLACNHFMKK